MHYCLIRIKGAFTENDLLAIANVSVEMEISSEQGKHDSMQNHLAPTHILNAATRLPLKYHALVEKENICDRRRSNILLEAIHGRSAAPLLEQGHDSAPTSILAEFLHRKRKCEDAQAVVECAEAMVQSDDPSIKLYSLLKERARVKLRSAIDCAPNCSLERNLDLKLTH